MVPKEEPCSLILKELLYELRNYTISVKVQAAGQYVSYLYCRQSLLTLMNAYIKGAISKQILRYLATFKREMLNLWLPSLQALTALHLLNMLAKMIIWHSLYYSKHSVNYLGISFLKKQRFHNIQICKMNCE